MTGKLWRILDELPHAVAGLLFGVGFAYLALWAIAMAMSGDLP